MGKKGFESWTSRNTHHLLPPATSASDLICGQPFAGLKTRLDDQAMKSPVNGRIYATIFGLNFSIALMTNHRFFMPSVSRAN